MKTELIVKTVKEFTDVPEVLDFYHAVANAADKLVSAAVAEERERCAKVAEEVRGWGDASEYIAAKIRSGE